MVEFGYLLYDKNNCLLKVGRSHNMLRATGRSYGDPLRFTNLNIENSDSYWRFQHITRASSKSGFSFCHLVVELALSEACTIVDAYIPTEAAVWIADSTLSRL